MLFESYYLGDMFVNSTSAIPTVIVSNLPNNSFTSIFAVFPSYRTVLSLQVQRCLRGLHGRTRSSLAVLRKIFPASCGHEVFVLKNLVRPNLYTEKPLKRNDRYDRKTHQNQKTAAMKPIKILKTALRALAAVPCALFLWVVYFTVGVAEALVCGVLQVIWSIILAGFSLACIIGVFVWLLTL